MIEQREAASRLHYLADYSETEICAFEEKYQATRISLDEILSANRKLYYWNLINQIIANYGSNALYLVFPIITSDQGLNTTVNVFFPHVTIPSTIGYGIGIPMAATDVAAYTLFYSVKKAAIKNTLDHVMNLSYRDQLLHWLRTVPEFPKQSALNLLISVCNNTVLIVTNTTGVMTELIYYLPYIPSSLRWPLTLITLYYGNKYYAEYTNEDYLRAIEDYCQRNRVAIFSTEYPASSFEILLQYASAVGLRAYPYFLYLAYESAEVLGFWFNPYFVTACALLHSSRIYLNVTVDFHLAARNKIVEYYGSGEVAIKELRIYRKEFIKTKGYREILKNPGNLAYLTIRALLGAYAAYGIYPYLSPIGGMIAASPLYFSMLQKRISEDYLQQKIGQSLQQETDLSRPYLIFALILTYSAALVTAMSTIGTLSSDTVDILKAAVVLFCVERMVNTIQYTFPKTKKTVEDIKKLSGHCYARLFTHQKQPATPIIQEKRLCVPY